MSAEVKFQRVLSLRSKDPGVFATVGGEFVKWGSRRGWDCTCLSDADEFECSHIEQVRGLLDARVLEPVQLKERS